MSEGEYRNYDRPADPVGQVVRMIRNGAIRDHVELVAELKGLRIGDPLEVEECFAELARALDAGGE